MTYPYELGDVSVFLQLARTGSMSVASKSLNIPKSTLSHSLRRLEDSLKVELFHRKANGLEMTDAGREFATHANKIIDACEAAADAAQRAHHSISGKVRIIGSSEFGTSIIGAAALHAATAHEQLEFDLQQHPNDKLTAGQIDFDCLIHVGEAPDSGLLQRKLGTLRKALFASPAFIARSGGLNTVNAINQVDGIIYRRSGLPESWELISGGELITVDPKPRFIVNEYWMAKFLAVEGMGVTYLPDFFARFEVQSGALVRVMPAWTSETVSVYVLYPAHRHRSPRVMTVIDALCANYDEYIQIPMYSLRTSS